MNLHKEVPNLVVYTPDRRTALSNVLSPYEFTCDYNFGTLSQMSFTVQKYIYNIDLEEWVKNPCYDYLDKDMVLCSNDNDNYFRFNARSFYESYEKYTITKESRNKASSIYNAGVNLQHVDIQTETELYDVGTKSGYNWAWGCYTSEGAYIDGSDNLAANYQNYACQEFFPVEVGDIIAIYSNGENAGYHYYIDAYNDATASSYTIQPIAKKYDDSATPQEGHYQRIRVNKSWFSNNNTKGYVRFSYYNLDATKSNGYYSTYPIHGYIKIYSGERHCSSIYYDGSDSQHTVKMPWWVVDSIEEETDGLNMTKTVTAYSYEYTLSKKSFSLSDSTLPLYIPPSLYNRVNGSNWYYDIYTNSDGSQVLSSIGSQRMEKGLVNQLLECLPKWEIGYVSSGLATKYRTFSNVDNANIYSFLMNEIQSAYNCFVIFDTENMTINFISKTDCTLKTDTTLSWNNVVKSMKITNQDNRFVTAMRVHTADDTYGIGLINPLGDNKIYNFSAYKEYMNFVADENKKRTLYEAANDILVNLNSTTTGDYRKAANELIKQNLEIVKLKTKLSEALTNYRSKADIINTYLAESYQNSVIPADYYISDKPRQPNDMLTKYAPQNSFANYHSETLFYELYALAKTYNDVKTELTTATNYYNAAFSEMKSIAQKASTKTASNSGFSEAEIKALSPFIVEGDWTNSNAVFSDSYSVDDIYNTLVDTYDDAKSEFDSIYSQRNYDFSIEAANILAIDEMKNCISNLSLGNRLYIEKDGGYIQPVLLSIHINYDDLSDFTMSFSTDYNRKPLELRFSDLFGTITQTSVETPAFTFND
jgi:hypothetical protein